MSGRYPLRSRSPLNDSAGDNSPILEDPLDAELTEESSASSSSVSITVRRPIFPSP